MYNKIAIIGYEDDILAFKALGLDFFSVLNSEEAFSTLKKLYTLDTYGIIFINENVSDMYIKYSKEIDEKTLPAILIIPSSKGTTGFSIEKIRRDVEKALGVDLIGKMGKE